MTGMVKLAGLVERTSKHGTRYLVGFMGEAKVIVCENRDRGEGDATHCIFLVTGQQSAQQSAQALKPTSNPAPKRTVRRGPQKPLPDTAISIDWQKPLAGGTGDPGYDWATGDRDIGL
jgi:hypothetical protein